MFDKEKLKKFLKGDNKKLKADLFLIFALGILLLIMSNSIFKNKFEKPKITEPVTTNNKDNDDYESATAKDLEKRLKKILSNVADAGEIDVMITTSYSSELVVAQDTKKEETNTEETATQGDKRNILSSNTESNVVLVENSDGSKKPLVLKELEPKIEGVVIVAQGGDNAIVKDQISRAAQALLNVPAHKVEVLKMK